MTTTTSLSRLDCHRITHDAERCLRNVRAGNPFALAALDDDLARFHAAYLSPICEPRTARRIHAAIDMIGDAAEDVR
jgi:hypothetical protein